MLDANMVVLQSAHHHGLSQASSRHEGTVESFSENFDSKRYLQVQQQ